MPGADRTNLQAAVVFTTDTWRNLIKEFVMQSINFIGLLCAIFLCLPAPKRSVMCKYANQPDAQDNTYAVHDGVCQRCQAGSDNGTWIDRYCTECQAALGSSLSGPKSSPPSKKSSPRTTANDPCDTTLYSDGARRYANNRYEVCTWGPNEWIEKVPDTHTVCNHDQSSGVAVSARHEFDQTTSAICGSTAAVT